jgi:hypothetical protein
MKYLTLSGWIAFSIVLMVFFGDRVFTTQQSIALGHATSFSEVADRCLQDVRDKKIHFEKSSSCISLKSLSHSFISAGGGHSLEFSEANQTYQFGRATAWSAVALDNALNGNRRIILW